MKKFVCVSVMCLCMCVFVCVCVNKIVCKGICSERFSERKIDLPGLSGTPCRGKIPLGYPAQYYGPVQTILASFRPLNKK